MAIILNGTQNGLPSDRLPSGYTPPMVTTVADFMWRYDVQIPLVFSTTATTSNPVTTMTAIVTGTNTAVSAILAADFLSTATVTAYAVINELTSNLTPQTTTSTTYLTNVVPSYLVSVTIFVKAI